MQDEAGGVVDFLFVNKRKLASVFRLNDDEQKARVILDSLDEEIKIIKWSDGEVYATFLYEDEVIQRQRTQLILSQEILDCVKELDL